jgi:tetrahydromethanopterin S-methyltransferase subunit A
VVEIRKADPAPDYPPEEGCYLRGNDYSPVAVLVILKWIREESPPEIEALVRLGVESGAALSGTLQTENIGLEKVICNVVANPNIRYLVVCGPESPGHRVGETILALMANGVDERKRIVGTSAQTPYLFNIPIATVERFRRQLTVIDLIDEGRPEVIGEAIRACYQEEPTPFRDYLLHDVGAYPEPPIGGRITWRVTDPTREPKSEEERAGFERIRAIMERARKAADARHGSGSDPSG